MTQLAVPDALRELPLDEDSLAALARLGSLTLARSMLWIVSCPIPLLGALAATKLAEVITPGHALADLHVATPLADRWKLAELDELVVRPSTYSPIHRAVIMVTSADRMEPSAAEHLLKTVEEPAAPTLFIFVVSDEGKVLPTLRSRAAESVRLTPLSPEARARLLVERGLDEAEATRVTELCGPHLSLATALGGAEPEVRGAALAHLELLASAPLFTQTPTKSALTLLESLDYLAPLLAASALPASSEEAEPEPAKKPRKSAKPARTPKLKASDPALKAASRELMYTLCDRLEAGLSELVGAAEAPGALTAVEAKLMALDAARRAARLYTPLGQVLPMLYARLALSR